MDTITHQFPGASVKLCFRPSSVADKKGRLYYRFIIKRKSFYHGSSYCIYPSEWNNQEGIVIGDSTQRVTELYSIKRRTRWETQELVNIIRSKIDKHELLASEDIIQDFERRKTEQSFRTFMQLQIKRLREMDRVRTAETYQSTYNSFTKFTGGRDMFLYEFDSTLVEDYERFLLSQGLIPNSSSFYMRILRTVLNRAVKQGLIPSSNFFDDVYTGIGATSKRAIGIDALKRMQQLDLTFSQQLDFARDMFLLSLYFRGMSFIDMANLRHKDLKDGYLVYYRKKTGQRLAIKWELKMSQILDKYPKGDKFLLPILKSPDKESRKYFTNISKQLNRWLRRIGKLAGIEIPLTMYVARHTWASMAKQKNIPIGVISDALGHNSEKTTRIYLSALDTSAVDNANSQILADL